MSTADVRDPGRRLEFRRRPRVNLIGEEQALRVFRQKNEHDLVTTPAKLRF